jgi:hypothetical protein
MQVLQQTTSIDGINGGAGVTMPNGGGGSDGGGGGAGVTMPNGGGGSDGGDGSDGSDGGGGGPNGGGGSDGGDGSDGGGGGGSDIDGILECRSGIERQSGHVPKRGVRGIACLNDAPAALGLRRCVLVSFYVWFMVVYVLC